MDAEQSHIKNRVAAGEAAAYIAEMSSDLAEIARRHGFDALGFILDMARSKPTPWPSATARSTEPVKWKISRHPDRRCARGFPGLERLKPGIARHRLGKIMSSRGG
ncbi:MAG: hypothetical protein R3D52_01460 [Xanthobacteraceae bacterium]